MWRASINLHTEGGISQHSEGGAALREKKLVDMLSRGLSDRTAMVIVVVVVVC